MTATELAKKVLDDLKATPLLMGLLIVNVVSLLGFGYTLHEVGNAMERREELLKICVLRDNRPSGMKLQSEEAQ